MPKHSQTQKEKIKKNNPKNPEILSKKTVIL
jgi:hypothetical protein